MKKAGLYDKNRYAYNARLLQSANTSFDSRGNDVTLGSGMRLHSNPNRSTNRPRYPGVGAETQSHAGSDRYSNMDGFSDTASKYSHSSSTKPRPATNANNMSGYPDRSTMAMSVWSSTELMGEDDISPSVAIVTKFAVTAFISELFCILLNLIILFSPGWGRATTDLRTDRDFQGKVFSYYGLWVHCTVQQYEEYLSDLDCRNSAIIGMDAWWTVCQGLSCVFTLVSVALFVMICFYVFHRKSRRRWPLAVTITIIAFLNFAMTTVVVVLFAYYFLDDGWWCCPGGNEVISSRLFWCWYLALASSLFQLVAFIMGLVESINLRR